MTVLYLCIAVILFINPSNATPSIHAKRWTTYYRRRGRCSYTDTICMNAVALRDVNKLRRSRKMSPLNAGTKAMLHNALAHCRSMAKKHRLYHQSLRKPICGTRVRSENVSFHHILPWRTTATTDLVSICMNQFLHSPSHRANMLSRRSTHTVFAVYFNRHNGYFWCTQTFWSNVHYGASSCAPLRRK